MEQKRTLLGEPIRMGNDKCPVCCHQMDAVAAVTHTEHATPRPGDFTICAHCASVNKFGEDLGLVVTTIEDLKKLGPEEYYILTGAKIAIMKMILRKDKSDNPRKHELTLAVKVAELLMEDLRKLVTEDKKRQENESKDPATHRKCVQCGTPLPLKDNAQMGDLYVCTECANINMLDQDLQLIETPDVVRQSLSPTTLLELFKEKQNIIGKIMKEEKDFHQYLKHVAQYTIGERVIRELEKAIGDEQDKTTQ